MFRDTNIRAHCCGTEDVEDEAVELRQFLDVVEPALEADVRGSGDPDINAFQGIDRSPMIHQPCLARCTLIGPFDIVSFMVVLLHTSTAPV